MTSTHVDPEAASATVAATRCRDVPLPDAAHDLSWEQTHGRACVACGAPLTAGDYRGVVMDRRDGLALDFDVWSCSPVEGALE